MDIIDCFLGIFWKIKTLNQRFSISHNLIFLSRFLFSLQLLPHKCPLPNTHFIYTFTRNFICDLLIPEPSFYYIHLSSIPLFYSLITFLNLSLFYLNFQENSQLMNPFDRLRKTINSVSINYVIPQEDAAQQQYTLGRQPDITSRQTLQNITSTKRQEQNIFEEKQANLIRQINSLSLKNQRIQKQLQACEIEKNQLIAQNCQLQKNNEVLESKLKQIISTVRSSEQKEKKYKEEIHRINNTVQQLGIQLNNERQLRKKISNDLNVLKESTQRKSGDSQKKISMLEDENNQLKIEIQERMKMLEFNIKKNTDDRKQQQALVNSIKSESEQKISILSAQNKNITDRMYKAIQESAVLKQKLDGLSQKCQKNFCDLESTLAANKNLTNLKNALQEENRVLSEKCESLQQEVQKLDGLLEEQKKNVKLKVVQIRDQTLDLELEMYKRQCKQLLQEKMLRDGSYSERLMSSGLEMPKEWGLHFDNK